MKIKPVSTDLAKLLMLAMLGVAINPEYNLYDVSLLGCFVLCLIFGIPLFYFHNRYWIRHLRQRKKRKYLLKTQGYYKTIDSTDCYYHKILDCPFVFMLHYGKPLLIPETEPFSDSDIPCYCAKWEIDH